MTHTCHKIMRHKSMNHDDTFSRDDDSLACDD